MEIFRHWGLEKSIHARELDLEPMIVWAPTVAAPIVRKAEYVQDSDPDLSPCVVCHRTDGMRGVAAPA